MDSVRGRSLFPLVLYAGGAAVIGQSILIRELMVSFYGTEFALAAALTCWLVFVPLGALSAGALLRGLGADLALFCVAALGLGVALPSQFLLGRMIRPLLGVEVGQFVSLPGMVLCAALAAGPVSFLVGFLFPPACRLEARCVGTRGRGISRVYVAEALGSCAAGAAMSFVLLPFQSPAAIALLAGALWLLACGLWLGGTGGKRRRRMLGLLMFAPGLLWPVFSLAGGTGARLFAVLLGVAACGAMALPGRRSGLSRSLRAAQVVSLTLAFLLALGFLLGGDDLRRWSLERRWRTFSRFELLESRETRYQHVDFGHREEQKIVVQNGLRGALFPDPWENPRAAALLLSEHPGPKSVLVIGGGLGGLCQHLVAADRLKVDHVEMDPALISLYRKHISAESLAPLQGEHFAAFACDGRRFVQLLHRAPAELSRYAVPFAGAVARRLPAAPYDVVLINLGDPMSASASRFYTVEFFTEVHRILTPDGVLALWGITGCETYLRGPLLRYCACLYRTLKAVFPHVVVRPGSEFCFFAGPPGVPTSDAQVLARRFDALGLGPPEMRYMFEVSQFLPERVEYVRGELEAALPQATVNTDDRPIAYALFLGVQEHFSRPRRGGTEGPPAPTSGGFFGFLPSVRPGWFVAPFLACLGLTVVLRGLFGRRRTAPWSCGFAIVTTGMFGLAAEVLIIYAYQANFGHVYRDISIIVGLFMLGLAAGASLSARLGGRPPERLLMALEAMQGVLLLALPALMSLLSVSPYLFILASPVAGVLAGAEFPLACRHALKSGLGTATVASIYDAGDHLGGVLGAAATGLVLIPAFGLASSAALLACAKAASLLALAVGAAGTGARR